MNRFIVGTGRCGSTLLSRMIAQNPEVLSLFEVLNGLDGSKRFQREPMTGAEFFALLSQVHPFVTMVLSRGYPVSEITYPFDAPGARYTHQTGVPWILGTTLPELTDEPEALFDRVRAFTTARPATPPLAHYEALFGWLTKELGRGVWVERSGAAIDYMGALDDLFEDARFLHIHRAGEEAALSMREHHAFRLAIMLAYQLPPEAGRATETLERLEGGRADDASDEISQLLASRPRAEFFGRWWTDQVTRGASAWVGLQPSQYRELRFEDLLANPAERLAEVAAFLELPDPDGRWREDAAALVRGVPPARAPGLPDDERARLEAACEPGNKLLGRA